jgi:hypothetical protein
VRKQIKKNDKEDETKLKWGNLMSEALQKEENWDYVSFLQRKI